MQARSTHRAQTSTNPILRAHFERLSLSSHFRPILKTPTKYVYLLFCYVAISYIALQMQHKTCIQMIGTTTTLFLFVRSSVRLFQVQPILKLP